MHDEREKKKQKSRKKDYENLVNINLHILFMKGKLPRRITIHRCVFMYEMRSMKHTTHLGSKGC